MKTLSIKQPWAALIAHGIKDIENRGWYTTFRGKLLIHASAKPDERFIRNDLAFLRNEQYNVIDDNMRIHILKTMQYSAIIGEVEVVGCIKDSNSIWAEPGQYHWQLAHAKVYQQPIVNVKGSLSLWEFNLPNNFLF